MTQKRQAATKKLRENVCWMLLITYKKGFLKSLLAMNDKMNVYTLKLELKSIKLSCQII